MFVASLNGHTDVVDLLIQAGADINLATTEVCNKSHPYVPYMTLYLMHMQITCILKWQVTQVNVCTVASHMPHVSSCTSMD